jgi:hypothetical protein
MIMDEKTNKKVFNPMLSFSIANRKFNEKPITDE